MSLSIQSLDHLVLTVADVDASVRFYTDILEMNEVIFGEDRKAVGFGSQKINLHPASGPFEPHARQPTAGSADLCFLTNTPLETVTRHLEERGVAVIEGPVQRTGAEGPILSIYIKDPDGNLLEIANPIKERTLAVSV